MVLLPAQVVMGDFFVRKRIEIQIIKAGALEKGLLLRG